MYHDCTNEELLRKYESGENKALDHLINRTNKMLGPLLQKRYRLRQCDVDDILQEAWIRFFQCNSYDRDRYFIAFFWRITHNITKDFFRAKRRRITSVTLGGLTDDIEPTYRQADEIMLEEAREWVRRRVSKLPRAAMIHCYLDGIGPSKLAAMFGLPVSSVRLMVHRAMKALTAQISESGC